MHRLTIALLVILMLASTAQAQGDLLLPVITIENAARLTEIRTYWHGVVTDTAWSPNNDYLAVAGPMGIWLYDTGNIQIAPDLLSSEGDFIRCVAFSPDGTLIAAGSAEGNIFLWDVASGEQAQKIEGRFDIWRLAFRPDGQQIAIGQHDLIDREQNVVHIWDISDLADPKRLQTLSNIDQLVWGIAFSADNSLMAFGGGSSLRLAEWNEATTTWDLLDITPPSSARVASLAFHPITNELAIGISDSGEVLLWDIAQNSARTLTAETLTTAWDLDFHPDGTILTAIGNGLHTWNLDTGAAQTVTTFTRPSGSVNFSPDGSRVLASSFDSDVAIWEVATSTRVTNLTQYSTEIDALAFSPDSRHLAIGRGDGSLWLWQLSGDEPPQLLVRQTEPITAVAFSSDGRLLAAGSEDGSLRLWNIETGIVDAELRPAGARGIFSIAIQPNGSLLVAGHDNGSISVWDTSTLLQNATFEDHVSRVWDLDFSADGQWLVSAGIDETLNLYNMVQITHMGVISLVDGVFGVAFKPDGSQFATSWSEDVFVWDTAAFMRTQSLSTIVNYWQTPEFPHDLVYHPSGTLLITQSNKEALVWDTVNDEDVIQLFTNTGAHLAASPDGRMLASGGQDGVIRLWGVKPLG